jgi:hypothetical protein
VREAYPRDFLFGVLDRETGLLLDVDADDFPGVDRELVRPRAAVLFADAGMVIV